MPLGYVMTAGAVRTYYAADGPAARAMARWAAGKTAQITDRPDTLDVHKRCIEGPLTPASVEEECRRFLQERMPEALPDDVLPRHPGFHATVNRDVVLEIDAKQSQAAAFGDGRKIRDFLEGYGAPYRIKFSGNSSPHFILPQVAYESLSPEGELDMAFQRLFSFLMHQLGSDNAGWLDSSFVNGDHFLRMPYSLNERTGLVSIPIWPEEYDAFEVDMAEAPRVSVDERWFETGDLLSKADGMRHLMEDAFREGSG